jgi:hypothetical protein
MGTRRLVPNKMIVRFFIQMWSPLQPQQISLTCLQAFLTSSILSQHVFGLAGPGGGRFAGMTNRIGVEILAEHAGLGVKEDRWG